MEINEDFMTVLERFVVLLYDRTSKKHLTVNEARRSVSKEI